MQSDRSYRIRDLIPPDAELAAVLHAACFEEDPWPASAFTSLLTLPGGFGFLAYEGDAPLGFLLCRAVADECEVLTLAVLQRARRQGIGLALLSQGLAAAAALGVRKMFLEVAVDNAEALGLYRRAGFSQTAVRHAYYRRGPGPERVDAVVMTCRLSEHSEPGA